MPTVSQHAQSIIDFAEQPLIAQLRPILENIEAEESALYREGARNGTAVNDAVAGRRRLASQGRVYQPPQTVTELATSAWGEFV